MKNSVSLLCLLPIFIFHPVITLAQAPDSTKSRIESLPVAYIQSMSNYLNLKLSMNNNINGFVVRSTSKFDIRPNDSYVLKLSADYRFFSFSYSYTPDFLAGNADKDLKGKTKASAYQFAFTFNHWVQGLYYERVKGYYLANTADYDPSFVEGTDPYVQFPDLQYTSYKGLTAYKFNKNFSFNSLSVQTERQLKSAGTLMPWLMYNYYIVDDKSPQTATSSSQKTNNFEALLSLSYFYTFVFRKNFYVSAGAAAGAGMIFTKLFTRYPADEIITQSNNAISRFETAGALGYNSERFFAGGQIIGSRESYGTKGTTTVTVHDRLNWQVFTGYRFNAPKLLKSAADKTQEKMPVF